MYLYQQKSLKWNSTPIGSSNHLVEGLVDIGASMFIIVVKIPYELGIHHKLSMWQNTNENRAKFVHS
jgi:hypothetical protein